MRALAPLWLVVVLVAVSGLTVESWLHSRSVTAHASDAPAPAPSDPSDPSDLLKAVIQEPTPAPPRASSARLSQPPLLTSATQILARGDVKENSPEGRLIAILSLIEQGRTHDALLKTNELIRQQPNFQLAHLVQADLLSLRHRPERNLDETTLAQFPKASTQLNALRTEAKLRLDALLHRPPAGTLPRQVLSVAGPHVRHVIAIDASRSRLYWFENQTSEHSTDGEFRLIGDFFISVGKFGTGKQVEGDGKTPLGIYHVTSMREGRGLPDLYGTGALPLNYPNALDRVRGQTGSGIWLHGTPSHQFVRPPLASDGCVVLANPDMSLLLEQVTPKTTPVVIAERLEWVDPDTHATERQQFEALIQTWQSARSAPDHTVLERLHAPQLQQLSPPSTPVAAPSVRRVAAAPPAPPMDFRVKSEVRLGAIDINLLRWTDQDDSMIATFEETIDGARSGRLRRQHWWKQAQGWLLLQDTVITPSAADAPPRAVVVASTAATPPEPVRAPTPVVTPVKPPVTTVAAPVPTPPPIATSAPKKDAQEVQDVQAMLQRWTRAWSQKNISTYLSHYAPEFNPPGGQSRSAWEQERKERIVPKSRIEVELGHVQIQVQGRTATVRFVQHYRADALKTSSKKTLHLIQKDQRWLITQETVNR